MDHPRESLRSPTLSWTSRALRWSQVLLLACCLLGCTSAFQKDMERGDLLLQRGDLQGALHAYQSATTREDATPTATQKVALTTEALFKQWSDQARSALAARDELSALQICAKIVQLVGLKDAHPLLDEITREIEARAAQHREEGNPRGALALYEDTLFNLPSTRAWITPLQVAANEELALLLFDDTKRALADEDFASALAFLEEAIELVPPERRTAFEPQRREIKRRWSKALLTQAKEQSAARNFKAALQSIDKGLGLIPEKQRGPLTQERVKVVGLWSQDLAQLAETEVKSHRYANALPLLSRAANMLPSRAREPFLLRHLEIRRLLVKANIDAAYAMSQRGQFENALTTIANSTSLLPPNEQQGLQEARLKIHREWAQVFANKAEGALKSRRFDVALQNFEAALQKQPETERKRLQGRLLVTRRAWAQDFADQGENALRARRFDVAVRSFEAALQKQPETERKRLQDRLLRARHTWALSIANQAEDALAKRDYPRALKLFEEAASRLPEGERSTMLRQRERVHRLWGDGFIAQAKSRAATGHYEDGFRLLEESLKVVSSREHPRLKRARADLKTQWSEDTQRAALRARDQGRLGEALFLCLKAAQRGDEARQLPMCDPLRRQLVEKHQFVVNAPSNHLSITERAALLDSFDDHPNRLMSLLFNRSGAPTQLDINFPSPKFEERVTSTTQRVPYISGSRQVPNPEHHHLREEAEHLERERATLFREYTQKEEAVRRLKREISAIQPLKSPNEQDLRSLEQEISKLKDKLGNTRDAGLKKKLKEQLRGLEKQRSALPKPTQQETQQAQKKARLEKELQIEAHNLQTLKKSLQEQDQALKVARKRHASSPSTLQEELRAVHAYQIHTHRLIATMQLSVVFRDANGNRRSLDKLLSKEFNDSTHASQPPIKLAPDPLKLPSRSKISRDLRTEAIKYLHDFIGEGFEEYRARVLNEAQHTSNAQTRLNYLVIYFFLNHRDASPQVKQALREAIGGPAPLRRLLGRR